MEYPLFEVPKLGGGMFVGIVAIIHVIIAHLAVGAGLFIAVSHTWAHKRRDALMFDFLYRYGRFLILLSFVSGAVTGVGIWITISLASPAGTSALIHLFVWGWAIEWVFFILEIVAGYVYYYGWHRLTPARHLAVAWLYFVGAFMSLVVINGIITFMLTPGAWQPPTGPGYDAQKAFFTAFMNPTYWPSLLLRTISCMAIAGISVAVVVNCVRNYSREQKERIIHAGSLMLSPIALMAPAAIWYFFAVPSYSRHFAFGGAIAMTLFFAFGVVSSIYIAGYTYWGLIRNRTYINLQTSVLLFAVAAVATGAMEFVREGIRKPYVIVRYMYSNQIPCDAKTREAIDRDGVLKHARFAYPPDMTLSEIQQLPLKDIGRYVFNAECRACHEPDGTNDVAQLIHEASRDLVYKMTGELERLKDFMPPFMGTEMEKRALVEYQLFLAHGPRYRPPPGDAWPTTTTRPSQLTRADRKEVSR